MHLKTNLNYRSLTKLPPHYWGGRWGGRGARKGETLFKTILGNLGGNIKPFRIHRMQVTNLAQNLPTLEFFNNYSDFHD